MFLVLLNIFCGLLMVLIFGLIVIFDYKNFKQEIVNIKLIVISAFLIAISVLLNTVVKGLFNSLISAKIFEARLGDFALVLTSFFCGGAIGFLAGIAADFLGVLVYSTGMPVLFFTLTSVLWCVVPYYLVKLWSKFYYQEKIMYFYLPLSYALTLLLITCIDPIVLKYMYNINQGWWLLYLPRIIKYPIDVVINTILLISSYKVFANRLNLGEKWKKEEKINNKKELREEKHD